MKLMRPTSSRRSTLASAICAVCLLGIVLPANAAFQSFSDGGIHTVNSDITPDGIEVHGSTTLNVETGAVVGSNASSSISTFDTAVLNMSGGKLNDELFLFNNSSATISGGEIVDDITGADTSTVVVSSVLLDDDIEARGSSLITVNGGSFDEDIETFESATVNVHGGMFQVGSDGGHFQAAQNSVINVYGGTFGVSGSTGADASAIIAGADDGDFSPPLQPGVVNLHGGDISGLNGGLQAVGFGTLNVYGFSGTVKGVTALNDGVINFFDGPLQNLTATGDGVVNLFGSDGSLNNIAAQGTVEIRIFGSGFSAFNGAVPLPFGPIAFGSGNLSGILADGTVLSNIPFTRNFVGTPAVIRLVPEPGTIALATIALGGLSMIRRRRAAR